MIGTDKLPLRPIVFTPAFLALYFLSVALREPYRTISDFCSAGLMLWWIVSATRFALKNHVRDAGETWAAERSAKLKRMSLNAVGGFAFILLLVEGQGLLGWKDNIWANLFVVPLAILAGFQIIAVFWMAARTIDEAETPSSKYDGGPGTFGTFLLLIYAPLTAFFVYRRLKRLAAV